jgi:hypothetical protein
VICGGAIVRTYRGKVYFLDDWKQRGPGNSEGKLEGKAIDANKSMTMRLNYSEVSKVKSMLQKILSVRYTCNVEDDCRMYLATVGGSQRILIREGRIPCIPGISYPATHDSVCSTVLLSKHGAINFHSYFDTSRSSVVSPI